MAIGSPPGFVAYVDTRPVRQASSARRAVVAAGILAVAACAAVLLVAAPRQTELIARADVKAKIVDTALATELIRSAPQLSVSGLFKIVQTWKDNQISDLNSGMQTLAIVPHSIETQLQDSGKLCEKKDVIIAKFNQLLTKLGYENKVRNETDQAAYDKMQAALTGWLDSESTYRLEVEKQKEAEEGATFARERYEKWAAAAKQTKERLDSMNVNVPKEQQDIADEIELLKTILRLLGILDEQPLDDTSKQAGGYMAAKKADSAVLKQLNAKIAELKIAAASGGAISLRQVDMLQTKLASFAETDAIKELIYGMLKDLNLRKEVLTKTLADTQTNYDDAMAKLVQYEQEVVDLSNAADKAKMKAAQKNLARQKLNGEKIDDAEEYNNEHAAFVIVAPPSERSIFIIRVIIDKVNSFCGGDKSVVGAGITNPNK